jgi:shikimate dehydrogenase
MQSPEPTLPAGFVPGADVKPRLVSAFLRAEAAGIATMPRHLRMAGLGTVAHGVLRSPGFRLAMEVVDFEIMDPHESPADLLADEDWDMTLVFSPHKRTTAELVRHLAPAAQATGVVDTLIRFGPEVHGFNTTSWAAQVVLEQFCGAAAPPSVLLLGAGASARSVLAAIRRSWGDAPEVTVTGRSAASLQMFEDVRTLPGDVAGDERPSLLVNCTAWGETPDSERAAFELPFAQFLRPGLRFLDLNNRVSALQEQALSAGAQVMSGIAVRDANNLCRAALAGHVADR